MPSTNILLQTQKLLAQRLAALAPKYNETACLHPEEREMIGACFAYIQLFGEETKFAEWLKTRMIPALTVLGLTRWPRTEMTDLGLRIGFLDTQQYVIADEPTEEGEEENIRS